jgi:hypothetical protein
MCDEIASIRYIDAGSNMLRFIPIALQGRSISETIGPRIVQPKICQRISQLGRSKAQVCRSLGFVFRNAVYVLLNSVFIVHTHLSSSLEKLNLNSEVDNTAKTMAYTKFAALHEISRRM